VKTKEEACYIYSRHVVNRHRSTSILGRSSSRSGVRKLRTYMSEATGRTRDAYLPVSTLAPASVAFQVANQASGTLCSCFCWMFNSNSLIPVNSDCWSTGSNLLRFRARSLYNQAKPPICRTFHSDGQDPAVKGAAQCRMKNQSYYRMACAPSLTPVHSPTPTPWLIPEHNLRAIYITFNQSQRLSNQASDRKIEF
jgi:hypothetical protein